MGNMVKPPPYGEGFSPALFVVVSPYGVSVIAVSVLCVNDGKSCVLHADDSVHFLPFLPV